MSLMELEWMQSPPVHYALRDIGYPSDEKTLVDFFEKVLSNTDKLGDALRRLEDPLNAKSARTKMGVAGFRGVAVTQRKANPWRASIQVEGKQKTLGVFPTVEDAIQARLDAEKKYYNTEG